MRTYYWVEPGKLAAGPHPRAESVQELLDAGITAFVDLTHAGELDAYDRLIGDAVHHRRSIGDFGIPTDDAMAETLDLIDALQADGHAVYVHCWARRRPNRDGRGVPPDPPRHGERRGPGPHREAARGDRPLRHLSGDARAAGPGRALGAASARSARSAPNP